MPMRLRTTRAERHFFRVCSFSSLFRQKTHAICPPLTSHSPARESSAVLLKKILWGHLYTLPPGVREGRPPVPHPTLRNQCKGTPNIERAVSAKQTPRENKQLRAVRRPRALHKSCINRAIIHSRAHVYTAVVYNAQFIASAIGHNAQK